MIFITGQAFDYLAWKELNYFAILWLKHFILKKLPILLEVKLLFVI